VSFKSVTCDNEGRIYVVQDDGRLLFYQDTFRDGTNHPAGGIYEGWANGGAQQVIGTVWDPFLHVFSGDEGIIYAIQQDGTLLYYKDLARNGTSNFDFYGSGQPIGSGWQNFLHVFSGGAGIIYAIQQDGTLLYYQDLVRNGSSKWKFCGTGQPIGNGWQNFRHVFGGEEGIIYAIQQDGTLLYYRDLARDGTWQWANGGNAQVIGTGWDAFTAVFYGGGGIIYAIYPDAEGTLRYYKDNARDGTMSWAFGGTGQTIGTGWYMSQYEIEGGGGWASSIASWVSNAATSFWNAISFILDLIGSCFGTATVMQGYCQPRSVKAGETIEFKVSASEDYEVTYVRLTEDSDGSIGIPMQPSFSMSACPQQIPESVARTGCEWQTSFSITIPSEWESGTYAARCVSMIGAVSHTVFVVQPPGNILLELDPPQEPSTPTVLLLKNENTWNAYNKWDGTEKVEDRRGSKYSIPPVVMSSFNRPNPETEINGDDEINHLTKAESWVESWLKGVSKSLGFELHVCTDHDFHEATGDLSSYKAIVLSTHPEYWTEEMLNHLESYLAAGGNLLYLGGNGIFERCQYSPEGDALIFFDGDPCEGRQRNYFRNLTPPRPERAILGVATLVNNWSNKKETFAPYEVLMANHPFFEGTDLNDGDLFGADGHNGGASGWEMDGCDLGNVPDNGEIVLAWDFNDRGAPPENLQILARGTNVTQQGRHTAKMTYYEHHPDGGFVFSVGSITFGGSLAIDPTLQKIVGNALKKCLGQ
jgi:N,N-dimethylformamidase